MPLNIPGIPEPTWGVTTTHWAYSGEQYNYGSGLEPYRMGPYGPYTHYVHSGHPNATDDYPYGTHYEPRVTYPQMRNLSSGSVVQFVDGELGSERFEGIGALERPIFIRGTTPGSGLKIAGIITFQGDYYVLENIDFDRERSDSTAITFAGDRTHFAIRDNKFHNSEEIPLSGRTIVRIYHYSEGSGVRNVLVQNNEFYNLGEGRLGGSYDVTAVGGKHNTENVWIVDNHFHHVGGDGVQLNMDNAPPNATPPTHYYIGRNTFHDNFENAVDLKMASGIVISSNKAYNFGDEHSAIGSAHASSAFRFGAGEHVGVHRHNVWVLFNTVYDSNCPNGAFSTWSHEAEIFADETYYIGNIVRDNHGDGDNVGVAFGCWNMKRVYYINNTIYNVDDCFNLTGERPDYPLPTEQITLVNNIAGELHPSGSTNFAFLGSGTSFERLTMNNNLFYDSGPSGAWLQNGVYDAEGVPRYTTYTYDGYLAAFPEKLVNSIHADPQHVDPSGGDFRLQATSPALKAAYEHDYYDQFEAIFGESIKQDFSGNPIPTSNWDIGALQYSTGPAELLLGIPKPDFGFENSHMAYSGTMYDFTFGPGLIETPIGPDGPYHYFVDPTHPSSTDSSNWYGTHEIPRASLPSIRNLASGSIVELHGSFVGEVLAGSGTADYPIYIRGSVEDKPTISAVWGVGGDNYIFENILWDLNQASSRCINLNSDHNRQNNIAIRNCEFKNLDRTLAESKAVVEFQQPDVSGDYITNVFISGCYFHHLGEDRVEGGKDALGIYGGPNTSGVWIVGNTFRYIGGDGIQLNAAAGTSGTDIPMYYYIGENHFEYCWENGLDLKTVKDVIVSRNTATKIGPAWSGAAYAAPFRWGVGGTWAESGVWRENVWALANRVWDCDSPDGLFQTWNFGSEDISRKIYYLNNIVHDCHGSGDTSALAFGSFIHRDSHYANNTVWNVDRAFGHGGEHPTDFPNTHDEVYIYNNIVKVNDVPDGETWIPLWISRYGTNESVNDRTFVRNNIFFDPSGNAKFALGYYSGAGPSLEWGYYDYPELYVFQPNWLVESTSGDPLLVDPENLDYTPESGSFAVNGGYDHGYYDLFQSRYGLNIKRDFYDTSLPVTSWDIGAAEGSGGLPYTPEVPDVQEMYVMVGPNYFVVRLI
jgi:hypothetical protein